MSLCFSIVAQPSIGTEIAQPNPIGKVVMDTNNERCASCYSFNAAVESEFEEVDVVLLYNREPITLSSSLVMSGEMPQDTVEKSRRIRWQADAGDVFMKSAGGEVLEGEAMYIPPDRSQVITVTAWAEVSFRRLLPTGEFETSYARFEQEFKLLSPADSSHLQAGYIDNYEVGEYLDPFDSHLKEHYHINSDWYIKHPDRYMVPNHFYFVDGHMKDWRIAPNVTLGMFAIDFPWYTTGLPQYVALDWNLVRKMEDLRTLMISDGYTISRFVPIYGFRSPAFNRGTIESQSSTNLKMVFSMHQYGRAIDMIVDENGDGQMDDLNGDGIVDIHDAAVMMYYVNKLDRQYREEGRLELVGGAGIYSDHDFVQRPVQSPYLHVDTRGFLNDSGHLIRWSAGQQVPYDGVWPDGARISFANINRRGYDR